jgi:SOS-response transcriptional repressor LexA
MVDPKRRKSGELEKLLLESYVKIHKRQGFPPSIRQVVNDVDLPRASVYSMLVHLKNEGKIPKFSKRIEIPNMALVKGKRHANLSPKELELLSTIEMMRYQNGIPPTTKELSKKMGRASTNTYKMIKNMESKLGVSLRDGKFIRTDRFGGLPKYLRRKRK